MAKRHPQDAQSNEAEEENNGRRAFDDGVDFLNAFREMALPFFIVFVRGREKTNGEMDGDE